MTDRSILDKLTWELRHWMNKNNIPSQGMAITITMSTNLAKDHVISQLYLENYQPASLGSPGKFTSYNNVNVIVKSQEDWASFH